MVSRKHNYGGPWYHGSDRKLTILRRGSSITKAKSVAKAFSHLPSLVSWSVTARIRHDGAAPGFLYIVAEEIGPDDVHPHPHPVNVDRWEWLTERELELELIERTVVTAGERLTDEEIAEARRKQKERGEESFLEWSA
ncbi:MAG: hypothetical protein OXG33_05260 [Chloroflexi bacterium]|nr:hypothetical protein [Chloroflexota bacterium]